MGVRWYFIVVLIYRFLMISDVEHLFLKRFYSFIFRQRGREGEREGEKHQGVVATHMPPAGDLAATQACALTGN